MPIEGPLSTKLPLDSARFLEATRPKFMDSHRLPSPRLRLELTWALVRRDLRARASQSALGLTWALIKPLTLTAILYVVFGTIVPIRVPTDTVPYWLHVLLSILTWNFLLGSVTEATHSIVNHGHLLRKVALDARVFPAAAIISHGIHYLAGLALVILVAMPLAGLWPSPAGIIALLPVIGVLALLALTLGLLLSACQVYLRDTASALELAGTAWFYGSPIIYPVSAALTALGGGVAATLYLLNPATSLLAAVRRCLIYPAGAEMTDGHLMIGVGLIAMVCILVLVLGSRPFLRVAGNFADRL